MAERDEPTLSRTYVLDADTLNETKSLEELAELAQHADNSELTASETGTHRTSSGETPTGKIVTND